MGIKLEEVKNAFLYIDNSIIEGKITEIDHTEKKVLFEFNPDSPTITAEMGKRGEVFFEYKGNRYFVSGKVFFQPPLKALIVVESNIEIERRQYFRKETPALPAIVSYTSGVFKKRRDIKATVLNICEKGARIEISEPLDKNTHYDIETSFPYHHTKIDFKASFSIKNFRQYRNIFIYGIYFSEMDITSETNLKKYLMV
ncbi:MAG: PilZ domain-containing protein [Candidatus Ratteibacteria bacterium]|nr:PilZ domain-containing protein [Candidatus Ratteibacteria bacterium]